MTMNQALVSPPMTNQQRDKLINDYACRIVDDMDISGELIRPRKDLYRAMAEQIAAKFEGYKTEEVIEEIRVLYPDLGDEFDQMYVKTKKLEDN